MTPSRVPIKAGHDGPPTAGLGPAAEPAPAAEWLSADDDPAARPYLRTAPDGTAWLHRDDEQYVAADHLPAHVWAGVGR